MKLKLHTEMQPFTYYLLAPAIQKNGSLWCQIIKKLNNATSKLVLQKPGLAKLNGLQEVF